MLLQKADHRLFFGSLLLSLGLHLGLAGLGVMTGWGRSLPPPTILEVNLVAAPGPGPAADNGTPGKGGAAAVTPAPPKVKKAPGPRRSRIALAPSPPVRPLKKEEASPPLTPKADSTALALATPPMVPGPLPPGMSAGSSTSLGGNGAGEVGAGSGGTGVGERSGGQGLGGAGPAQAQYLSLIRARILARRHYPHLARQRHQEGVVRVRFRLSPAGALSQGVEVVRPSGFGLLDEQARQCVLAAAPFPPFPSELPRDHLTIEVPIVYHLTERE